MFSKQLTEVIIVCATEYDYVTEALSAILISDYLYEKEEEF